MKKDCFVVFGSGFDYCKYMCYDILDMENVQFNNNERRKGFFIYKLFHNRYTKKLFNTNIGYRFLFDKKKLSKTGKNHFVFFDSNPLLYDAKFLQYIRSRIKNSTISIIFVNTMATRNMRDVDYFRTNSDLIYTIDVNDAKEYDFIYLEGLHSKINSHQPININSDITFAGADKNRGHYVKMARDVCLRNNLKYTFTVVNMQNAPDDINTIRLPYEKVLEQELQSKCILEICVGEQNALTLRAIEAIMYDKFLITNNKNIVNCTYYDENKIKIFENEQELEKHLLSIKNAKTNYDYKGDFSPLTLFNNIIERTKKEG